MLTDTQIRNTRPGTKIIKLTDNCGLYLEVSPSGGKHWRYRFKLGDKESLFGIGEYPRVKAAEARRLRDEARELVKQGINPAADLHPLSEGAKRSGGKSRARCGSMAVA